VTSQPSSSFSVAGVNPEGEPDEGPAVQDGVIQYVSPSQLMQFSHDEYAGCHRRWWFRKVMKVPEPTTAQQSLGKKLHAEMEHYLRTGEDILGPIARAGKHFVPQPLSVRVEHRFTKESRELLIQGKHNAYPVVGQIDVINPSGYFLDNEGLEHQDPPNTVEILDWKNTSSLEYGKTGPQLGNTIQMITYGKWAGDQTFFVEENEHTFNFKPQNVRLSHGYFQTKGPKAAKKVSTILTLTTVKERWHSYTTLIEGMEHAARIEDPKDVPANYASCGAFKGCPYRAICPRPKELALIELFGGNAMGLMDRLRSVTNTAPDAPVTPPAVSTPPVASAPAQASTTAADALSDLERRKKEAAETFAREEADMKAKAEAARNAAEAAKLAPTVNYGFCNKCGTPLNASNGSKLASGAIVHVGCPASAPPVIPPDAPVNVPRAEPIPAENLATMPPAVQAAHAAVVGTNGTPPVQAEAPKKRGPKPKPAVGAPPTQPGDPELDAAIASTFKMVTEGIIMYVDAIPTVKGNVVMRTLDSYIANLCAMMEAEFKVVDIRIAPNDSPLGFGKWKGALAALAKSEPPESGAYVLLNGSGELQSVVAEALKPLCSLYVQGV
jgi:hypothetical protein